MVLVAALLDTGLILFDCWPACLKDCWSGGLKGYCTDCTAHLFMVPPGHFSPSLSAAANS